MPNLPSFVAIAALMLAAGCSSNATESGGGTGDSAGGGSGDAGGGGSDSGGGVIVAVPDPDPVEPGSPRANAKSSWAARLPSSIPPAPSLSDCFPVKPFLSHADHAAARMVSVGELQENFKAFGAMSKRSLAFVEPDGFRKYDR